MKIGILFTYDVKVREPKEVVKFHRELYGYRYFTKEGEKRKGGILTEIPFINPTRSCIIVRKEDAKKIIELLKKHKVVWSKHEVNLSGKEIKQLYGD